MNKRGLVAPLLPFVERSNAAGVPFVAIGDRGIELGTEKVLDRVRARIPNRDVSGCVISTDHLVAASVSNWGVYALVAGVAIMKAAVDALVLRSEADPLDAWVAQCLSTKQEEIELLHRYVSSSRMSGQRERKGRDAS